MVCASPSIAKPREHPALVRVESLATMFAQDVFPVNCTQTILDLLLWSHSFLEVFVERLIELWQKLQVVKLLAESRRIPGESCLHRVVWVPVLGTHEVQEDLAIGEILELGLVLVSWQL